MRCGPAPSDKRCIGQIGRTSIVPAGLAGAAALLRYAGEFEAGGCGWPCDPEDPEDENGDKWTIIFHHSLAAALEAMTS